MEGFGSRQSRAASRYGSSPAPVTAPVFKGPVRKWKKQWVSCRPNGGGNGDGSKSAPPLLLYRWTPVSSDDATDEPPRRRPLYAPIVVIEVDNKEDPEKVGNETGESRTEESDGGANILGKHSARDILADETEELSEDQSNSNGSMPNDSN